MQTEVLVTSLRLTVPSKLDPGCLLCLWKPAKHPPSCVIDSFGFHFRKTLQILCFMASISSTLLTKIRLRDLAASLIRETKCAPNFLPSPYPSYMGGWFCAVRRWLMYLYAWYNFSKFTFHLVQLVTMKKASHFARSTILSP